MKQKLCMSVFILVGVLVLAGWAMATDPKAADGQSKEAGAGAAPGPRPQCRPGPDPETRGRPYPRQRHQGW